MSENHKIKIRNNLEINFHNHISKPSYLITINPEKFLQKSNFNSAMTIKERNEINPEMAEIVRKILLKQKKEKNKKNFNNHSVSVRKDRKVKSLRKYFNENYNNKNKETKKENEFNNNNDNNALILNPLSDRYGLDYKNVKYFDYINQSINNKIKILKKKRLAQNFENDNNSVSKNEQKNLLNNSYIPNMGFRALETDPNFDNKLNNSLNLELNDESNNNNKGVDSYESKLNSITIDEDKIYKDESIMEIKCDYSYNEIISKRNFLNKGNDTSEKKKLNQKKIKTNYIDNKNIEKDSISVKNIRNRKFNEYNINNTNKLNNKMLNYNQNSFFGNIKEYNKFIFQSNQINGNKSKKLILNKSQEHRTKNELNNIYNKYNYQNNLTIKTNFFKNNIYINSSSKKTRRNHSANKRGRNIYLEKKESKNKNINDTNEIKNISQNITTKFNSPNFHSKNSSNLSTEFSHNNNNNQNSRKIIITKQNEPGKIGNLKDKKTWNKPQKINNHKEIISNKRKINSKLININKTQDNKKFLKSGSNKSLFKKGKNKNNNQKINKKEYPNMASSKNKEIKCIKKIESLCKKGYNGPGIKKTNQDNFFIYNNFNNNQNYVYLGVCDGHGLLGQDISTYLANNLPQNMNKKFISKNLKNLSNEQITHITSIFHEVFYETNIALNSDERIDSTYSGSTCVSVLFTPNRLYCINVGDSRCILGNYKEKEKKWITKILSRDHKPSEPDEMIRIKNSGGIVESCRDKFGNFVGPERVWGKNLEGPGLAMSRSFGDEMGHEIGIVVDPEILEHFFDKDDKFIILASDGIWEFMTNEEVVDIVKDYYLENNIQGAIEHLYNEASKRWIMEEEVIDDITVIIIFLN